MSELMEIRNNLSETRHKLRKLWSENHNRNYRMLDLIQEMDNFIYTFDRLMDTPRIEAKEQA